jgi:hypothetical protein
VSGCCECGDEPSGSCVTELVSYTYCDNLYEDKYVPVIRKQAPLLSLIGNNYCFEEVLNLMKDLKSRTGMRLTDKHLARYVHIATEIRTDFGKILNESIVTCLTND